MMKNAVRIRKLIEYLGTILMIPLYILDFYCEYFGRWRFQRRLYGGRWERWWVDWPVCSSHWHYVDPNRISHWDGGKPTPLCSDLEDVEYYFTWEDRLHRLAIKITT